MQRIVVLCVAAVLAPTSALVCRDTSALTRRGLLKQTVAAAAPLLTLGATPVWANTQAELSEQSAKSIDNEQKRAAFNAAQKVYKKAWRKELANLEYLTTDEERIEAIRSMLIVRPSLTLTLTLALALALTLALALALTLTSKVAWAWSLALALAANPDPDSTPTIMTLELALGLTLGLGPGLGRPD